MFLQDPIIHMIAEYLSKNSNMRSLNLDGNEISDYGL